MGKAKKNNTGVGATGEPAILRYRATTGIEVPALTEAQMREVDRIAIEETGPNLYQMMENAGRSLALMTMDSLGDGWPEARILVLAGTGGNGGGGICAGRHLANRGVQVTLCLTDPQKLSGVPESQIQIYRHAGGREVLLADLQRQEPDLILDAVIGYSLRAAPRGTAAEMIKWANESKAEILSLDIPSGVDATTGATPGVAVTANSTLTLALPKTGLLPANTGELQLADIGIPGAVYQRLDLTIPSPFGREFRVGVQVLHQKTV